MLEVAAVEPIKPRALVAGEQGVAVLAGVLIQLQPKLQGQQTQEVAVAALPFKREKLAVLAGLA